MKTIIIDLDGVVYHWIGAMAYWLHENGVLSHPAVAIHMQKKYEIWEDWNIPKGEFMRWWRLGIEAGRIYGEGTPLDGSRSSLWKLNDAGWNIHICTKRLTKFGLHDQIVLNTAKWLHENNIPYRELSIVNDKTRILADAIVDDGITNMNPEVHGKCFLFPTNENKWERQMPQKGIIYLDISNPWTDILEELL